MNEKAKVIIISSVSGGGKNTIIKMLRESYPELSLAVTATTRAPRKGEIDGKDYYFYTQKKFQDYIQNGEKFLEYAKVHGNYYGVPAEPVLEKLRQGKRVILNIDVQGMESVKKKLGSDKVLSFFLLPPSPEVWEQRLRRRMTDTEEQIRKRLKQGAMEMKRIKEYDHVVINDALGETLKEFTKILKQKDLIP